MSPHPFPYASLLSVYFILFFLLVARCGNLDHQLQLPIVTLLVTWRALVRQFRVLVAPYRINDVISAFQQFHLLPLSFFHTQL